MMCRIHNLCTWPRKIERQKKIVVGGGGRGTDRGKKKKDEERRKREEKIVHVPSDESNSHFLFMEITFLQTHFHDSAV